MCAVSAGGRACGGAGGQADGGQEEERGSAHGSEGRLTAAEQTGDSPTGDRGDHRVGRIDGGDSDGCPGCDPEAAREALLQQEQRDRADGHRQREPCHDTQGPGADDLVHVVTVIRLPDGTLIWLLAGTPVGPLSSTRVRMSRW
jgi:hypothetical protein